MCVCVWITGSGTSHRDPLQMNVLLLPSVLPHHHTAASHMGTHHRPPHTSFPAASGGGQALCKVCSAASASHPLPVLTFPTAYGLLITPPPSPNITPSTNLSIHGAHALLWDVSPNPTLFFLTSSYPSILVLTSESRNFLHL